MRDGLIILALGILLIGAVMLSHKTDLLQERLNQIEHSIEEMLERLQEEPEPETDHELEELKERMREWLDTWEVEMGTVTNYAPLDPNAIEGMCFEGDPTVTASGHATTIGESVAA